MMHALRFGPAALLVAAGLCLSLPARADDKKPAAPSKKPQVEVVFCLDTTGSMGGLIEAAKQKIWAISNQVASGKPSPELKVGLVAYRDKGDAYVTKVSDLSSDLDAVYATLKTFQAQGGGDTPEHVNQALFDAVNKIKWSTDKKTLRIIFLVGDAPAHMDYKDDVKYPETCKEACKKGIIINTVQCGSDATCAGNGAILRQSRGHLRPDCPGGGCRGRCDALRQTPWRNQRRVGPFDADLRQSPQADGGQGQGAGRDGAAGRGQGRPCAFLGKGDKAADYDLLDAVKRKEVQLEKLKKAELPPQLQKLDLKGQQEYLKKLGEKRAALSKEARELDGKRATFIKKKLADPKKGGKNAFDNQVLEMLRKQAKRANIDY